MEVAVQKGCRGWSREDLLDYRDQPFRLLHPRGVEKRKHGASQPVRRGLGERRGERDARALES